MQLTDLNKANQKKYAHLFSGGVIIDDLQQSHNDLIAKRTVLNGRSDQLSLIREGNSIPLKDWANEILDKMVGIAEFMDSSHQTNDYTITVQGQIEKLRDSGLTTSAQILREMKDTKESFFEFAYRKAKEHENYFKQHQLPEKIVKTFTELSATSVEQQRLIEENDRIPFDQFIAEYFAQH